jgi:hypothetical protein
MPHPQMSLINQCHSSENQSVMIKGIRKLDPVIQDEKVKQFLKLLNIEYYYIGGHPLGEMQFIYKNQWFEFELDVTFDVFITSFLESFYMKGFNDAVNRIYFKVTDAIYEVEGTSQESFENRINSSKPSYYEQP